ncbi:hypothetical protein J6Z48_01175 [bacterium]|nr:hypothetical protein [bacterium]
MKTTFKLEKCLIVFFGVLFFFSFFKNNVLAVTTIELVNKGERTVDLVVNSGKTEFLNAINIKIRYSSDDVITKNDVTIANNMCANLKEVSVSNNVISILCFNTPDVQAKGTLASIHYTPNSENANHFFYVDENSLDLGDIEYLVTNINKPSSSSVDREVKNKGVKIEIQGDQNVTLTIKSFLINYPFYTLLIVITLIAIAAVIIGLL